MDGLYVCNVVFLNEIQGGLTVIDITELNLRILPAVYERSLTSTMITNLWQRDYCHLNYSWDLTSLICHRWLCSNRELTFHK